MQCQTRFVFRLPNCERERDKQACESGRRRERERERDDDHQWKELSALTEHSAIRPRLGWPIALQISIHNSLKRKHTVAVDPVFLQHCTNIFGHGRVAVDNLLRSRDLKAVLGLYVGNQSAMVSLLADKHR